MPAPQCPNCHGATRFAGNHPYCPNCGWNRDVAIANLRGSLKMMPVGVIAFAGFAAFMIRGWHFRNPIQIAIFAGFPAFAILFNYIFARNSLAKLEAMPAPAARPEAASGGSGFAGGRSEGGDTGLASSAEASAKYQALIRASLPREIRMSLRGRFGIIGAIVFSWGIAIATGLHVYTLWVPQHSFVRFRGGDWITAAVGMLLLLVPYGVWRGQVKECDLLENGEVALAKVIRQWSDKNGASIECEFKDFSGQPHKLIASDTSRTLYEGMSVPVFYDRDNPNRQIAYCATLHEVVT